MKSRLVVLILPLRRGAAPIRTASFSHGTQRTTVQRDPRTADSGSAATATHQHHPVEVRATGVTPDQISAPPAAAPQLPDKPIS